MGYGRIIKGKGNKDRRIQLGDALA